MHLSIVIPTIPLCTKYLFTYLIYIYIYIWFNKIFKKKGTSSKSADTLLMLGFVTLRKYVMSGGEHPGTSISEAELQLAGSHAG